ATTSSTLAAGARVATSLVIGLCRSKTLPPLANMSQRYRDRRTLLDCIETRLLWGRSYGNGQRQPAF
ncbi:MAG: hypothetical protein WCD75_11635, partial [Rhodoplanes sp.]